MLPPWLSREFCVILDRDGYVKVFTSFGASDAVRPNDHL